MQGTHWEFGDCIRTSSHPNHTLWTKVDSPSAETLLSAGKEASKLDPPATTAPFQMWKHKDQPAVSQPRPRQMTKHLEQESISRTPFRLILISPGGPTRDLQHPQPSSTLPLLTQQSAVDAGGDQHPGAAVFPACSCLQGRAGAQPCFTLP